MPARSCARTALVLATAYSEVGPAVRSSRTEVPSCSRPSARPTSSDWNATARGAARLLGRASSQLRRLRARRAAVRSTRSRSGARLSEIEDPAGADCASRSRASRRASRTASATSAQARLARDPGRHPSPAPEGRRLRPRRRALLARQSRARPSSRGATIRNGSSSPSSSRPPPARSTCLSACRATARTASRTWPAGGRTRRRSSASRSSPARRSSRAGAARPATRPTPSSRSTRTAAPTRSTGGSGSARWRGAGNWKLVVERTPENLVRVTGGFNDFDFGYRLAPGERLETPRFYGGFTGGGFGEASRLLAPAAGRGDPAGPRPRAAAPRALQLLGGDVLRRRRAGPERRSPRRPRPRRRALRDGRRLVRRARPRPRRPRRLDRQPAGSSRTASSP